MILAAAFLHVPAKEVIVAEFIDLKHCKEHAQEDRNNCPGEVVSHDMRFGVLDDKTGLFFC